MEDSAFTASNKGHASAPADFEKMAGNYRKFAPDDSKREQVGTLNSTEEAREQQEWARQVAIHCNTLQHTQRAATSCNTLQNTLHTASNCNTLRHTATHYNTLQHAATRCNTLQHTHTTHRNIEVRKQKE